MLMDPFFTDLRRREYSRLDRSAEAYLDYTGSALYSDTQITRHTERMKEGIFGNPHSENAPSRRSTSLIEEARERVLRFLDAREEDYSVTFTANTSAAIKLVAESYPFGRHASLTLAADNHNSMNGIRQFAMRAGAAVHYLPLDDELQLADAEARLKRNRSPGLFGFPAQSNFSGVRHRLDLVDTAHDHGYEVLLDAAAFLPTTRLSLRKVAADFVVFSAYKVLGFPTGVGALVARKGAAARLTRPWFAGGTVEYASVQHPRHLLQSGPAGFEDGTPAFLDIAALSDGFDFIDSLDADRVCAHLHCLTAYAWTRIESLGHSDGSPLTEIYGPASRTSHGGTIAFNVLRRDGTAVPFIEVVERARAASVSLRGGCFCNPGAAEAAFDFPAEKTRNCLDSLDASGFSIERLAECLGSGVRVGAVRASFGIPTNRSDIDRAVDVIESFRDS
jgi:selenocysteine lyase/cysteine desulfurase